MTEPKTLQEILHNNPEARAYWREVSQRIAEGHAAQEAAQLDCETCGGKGCVRYDVPVNHPSFGKLFPCPNPKCPVRIERQQQQDAKRFTLAQIPKGYQDLTFADWWGLYDADKNSAKADKKWLPGKQDAFGAALAFVDARERGFAFTMDEAAAQLNLPAPEEDYGARCSLALYGAPGLGKTSLAVAIARFLLENGYGVIYLQLKEFFDSLKDTFKQDAEESEIDVLRSYKDAPVLILDEFGIDATLWQRGRAYDLVNYRYANRLPTVITTNYTVDELIVPWGIQTGTRLQAMAHWIEIGGVELRTRNAMVKSR